MSTQDTDTDTDTIAQTPQTPQTSQTPRKQDVGHTEQRHLERARAARWGAVVIPLVAEAYNLVPEDITGRRRLPVIVEARRATMYYLYTRHNLGPADVARVIGRDHSTVLFNIARAQALLETNTPESRFFRATLTYVRQRLRGLPATHPIDATGPAAVANQRIRQSYLERSARRRQERDNYGYRYAG